jgi:glycosyltransferase involved in cell wall biosynthesis
MDLRADAQSALELWRILRRERPDVLHTHTPKPSVYGRIIGRIAGVPIVVNSVHGLYATRDDPWAKRLAVYMLEALAARFSDAELIQNPEDLEFMRCARITRRARLLGNGVDLFRFDPTRFTKADVAAMRESIGAAADQLVIGAVGRLVAEKGYKELFEAVERLDPSRYLLVVIGADDPDKPDALPSESMARARAHGVRFLGHRDDIDALYAAMDLFVLASHREGYPRAAMEAAAMGLPVIATDIRGSRQVVEPGRTGLLVPPRDVDAIAGAIEKLGGDPSLRTELGHAGHVVARSRFDERKVSRIVIETYSDVGARKGIPPEPLDVLQVVASDDRRGPETHALDLAAALEARGLRVRTVALAAGLHGRGLHVPTLGRHALAPGTLHRLRRESSGAAAVVAHGSTTLPACTLALVGSDVPLVYRSVGDPGHWGNTIARRARVRAYLRRADAVVALTTEAGATIQAMHRVPGDRVAVIPIGVAPDGYEPVDARSRRAARAQLGIPDDANVGSVVGALSHEKNVALAIDATAEIPGFHLIVAGDGPEREALRRRARQVAHGRMHFTGALRDPAVAFQAADVVLLPSRTEGLPAVLLEAGLRTLPVVATDVGYVSDIVVDGQTGLLVEPGNRADFASAIERVLREGTEFGRCARTRCLARFDLELVADQWELLLSHLGNRGPSPRRRRPAVPPTLALARAAKTTLAPGAGFEEQ